MQKEQQLKISAKVEWKIKHLLMMLKKIDIEYHFVGLFFYKSDMIIKKKYDLISSTLMWYRAL